MSGWPGGLSVANVCEHGVPLDELCDLCKAEHDGPDVTDGPEFDGWEDRSQSDRGAE